MKKIVVCFLYKIPSFFQPLMSPIYDLHMRKKKYKKLRKLSAAMQWIINRIATIQHLFVQNVLKL